MVNPTSKITLVSVPSDVGSVYPGKSRAPAALRSAGLVQQLQEQGYTVSECDALSAAENGLASSEWRSSTAEPNGARNEDAAVAVCHQVKKAIGQILDGEDSDPKGRAGTTEEPFVFVLGGECLIVPSILSALAAHYHDGSAKPNNSVGLLYIDADCDLTIPNEAGSTGNIAGMTLTHATLRQGHLASMTPFSLSDGSGVINSNNIVFFGLNTASPANKRHHLAYLFDEHFRVVTADAVAKDPVSRATQALRWLEERVDHIWIHLDVDVIDPGRFPLGNVPSWTGVGFDEVMSALAVFLSSKRAVGLSLAEVNPDHDVGGDMVGRLVHGIAGGLKRVN